MNKDFLIKTERLVIRPVKVSDVNEAYIKGLNDPEVNRYLFDARFMTHTEKSTVTFVESNAKASDAILFGFFEKTSGAFIGTARVSKVSPIHFSASLGICLFDKSFWRKGIGTEGVKGIVETLFKELGLHYIEAGAYIENKASIALFKKAGFTLQAEFKQKFRFENDFMPVVFLGKTNPAFDRKQLKQ